MPCGRQSCPTAAPAGEIRASSGAGMHLMSRLVSCPILAFALACAVAGTLGCTSAETSTAIVSPTSDKCQVQVENAPSAFAAGGGPGTVTITTSRDCTWSLKTSVSWVSVGATNGQGNAA